MPVSSSVMKRLAFAKYILGQATEQSKAPEPLSSLSLLSFHDAVEWFLELSAEHLGASRGGSMNLMDYWDAFLRLSPPVALTERATMEALNRARSIFKHYGTMPSATNIEGFRANATRFIEDNTQTVFGISFADVSLVELVTYARTKASLTEAETLLRNGDFQGSLEKSALAYAQLVRQYEDTKRDRFGRTPFFFGDMTFVHSFRTARRIGVRRSSEEEELDSIKSELNDFIRETKNAVDSLSDAVKTLALGIDFRMFLKFRLVTPLVRPQVNDTFSEPYWLSTRTHTQEEADFALNFVIESAISLQENDWS